MSEFLKKYIDEVKDFPKKGIIFRDISPLLSNKEALKISIQKMSDVIAKMGDFDYFVGIDARGFIFASTLALHCKKGILMCRKKGKLPPPLSSINYHLEYGFDSLELKKGTGKVVVIDDVLATGGTLKATNDLCKKAGYELVGNMCFIDLKYIRKVENCPQVERIISYE